MSRRSDLRHVIPSHSAELHFPSRAAISLEVLSQRYPLMDYIATYGIGHQELERHHLTAFLAARNCEGLLDSLQHTPLATDVSQRSHTVPIQLPERSLTQPTAGKLRAKCHAATDHSHIGRLEKLSDITRARPIELARMVTTPELFLNRVVTRQLTVREYLESDDINTLRKSTSHEGLGPGHPTQRTQRALVMIDVTKSMDTRDNRGVVAAGLALAYLRRAAERGGALHLAPFTKELKEVFSGEGMEGLPRLARAVLSLRNEGVTNIQRSLEQATTRILNEREFEHDDVLLLTDGLSRLTNRPAALPRLHTFLLGNHEARTEQSLRDILEFKKQRLTLMKWSETFEELRGDELGQLMTLTAADFSQVRSLAYRCLEPRHVRSQEQIRVLSAIQHLLAHVQFDDATLSGLSGEIDRAIAPIKAEFLPGAPENLPASDSSSGGQLVVTAEESHAEADTADTSSVRLQWRLTRSSSSHPSAIFIRLYDLVCAWGKKLARFFNPRS